MEIDINRIALYLAGKLPPYYRSPFDKLELIELIRKHSPAGFSDDFFKLIDSQDFYSICLNRVKRADSSNSLENVNGLLDIVKNLNVPEDAGGLGENYLQLSSLRAEYEEMKGMTNTQERGFKFEKWLEKLFNLFGLDARGSYKAQFDQIDGSFELDGKAYLFEAKWLKDETDTSTTDRLFARLDRCLVGTVGFVISQSGFTQNSIDTASRHKNILLLTGNNLESVLSGKINLPQLLKKIRRKMTEEYIPLED